MGILVSLHQGLSRTNSVLLHWDGNWPGCVSPS